MATYDANTAPDPRTWLALDEQERISLVIQSHQGCFPDALHREGANEVMHGSLHAIVETQLAEGEPAVTRATVDRLCLAGLKRHAALHSVMWVLAESIGRLSGGDRFDRVAWEQQLLALQPDEVVGRALRSGDFGKPEAMNRAQRRAAKEKSP